MLNLYLTRYKYQISCELIDYNIFFWVAILNMTFNIFRDETGRIFGILVNLGTRQLLTAAGFTKENNAPASSSFYSGFTSSKSTYKVISWGQ